MPFPVLNSNAVIMCIHGGKVTVIPKQFTVQVGGAPAICVGDLMGSPIAGCAQVPTPAGTAPCLVVAMDPMPWASKKMMVGGKPVLTQMPGPGGLTSGNPPGMIICSYAGQTAVVAD